MKPKYCIDCPTPSCASAARKTPHPGPRCQQHWKIVLKARKERTHDQHVSKTYNVALGFYARLYEHQGKHCAICQRATGASKRLALDHNHKTGQPRGLLCGPCNQLLGRVRDDPEALRRAARYLEDPPAAALLISED